MFVLARDKATSTTDRYIMFRDSHGPTRQIVLDRNIRSWFGFATGAYYLCFYASTPYTAQLVVNEGDY